MANRYFKLAEHAFSFSDAASGVVIRPNETVEIENTPAVSQSKRLKAAITGGHVVEVKEKDAENVIKLAAVTLVPPANDAEEKEKKTLRKNIKASDLPEADKKKLQSKTLDELKAIASKIPAKPKKK